jgi:hypothetical protein
MIGDLMSLTLYQVIGWRRYGCPNLAASRTALAVEDDVTFCDRLRKRIDSQFLTTYDSL